MPRRVEIDYALELIAKVEARLRHQRAAARPESSSGDADAAASAIDKSLEAKLKTLLVQHAELLADR